MLTWWTKFGNTVTFHGLIHVSLIINEVEHFVYIYWALHSLTCSNLGQFRWIKGWQEKTHMNLFKSIDKFCVSERKRSYGKFFSHRNSQSSKHHLLIRYIITCCFKCQLYHLLSFNIHLALCLYLSITMSKSVFIIALF